MGGIISDNLGRSSGLIKGAAAPAGIVLVDSAYASSTPGSGGYVTWTSRGTSAFGGSSYGAWGGVLAGSSLAITWGSTIAFPATGVYHIWFESNWQTSPSSGYRPLGAFDDGSWGASDGFIYPQGPYYGASPMGGSENVSHNFSYTVDDISQDKLRFYKTGGATMYSGQGAGSLIIAKFE